MNSLKKSDNRGFIKGYLIYLSVLLAVLIAVLSFVWVKLIKYQRGIDSEAVKSGEGDFAIEAEGDLEAEIDDAALNSAAMAVFSDYIDSLSDGDWVELYKNSNPQCLDKDEDIIQFLRENVLSYKNSRFRASDYTVDEPKFLIGTKSEGKASFILEKSGTNYSILNVNILKKGEESVTFTAYEGALIHINGNDFAQEADEKSFAEVSDYVQEMNNPSQLNVYTLNALINPEALIEVENSYAASDGIYYESVIDASDFVRKSEDFIKALLKYYSQGKSNVEGNMANVLSHVDGQSEAAKVIRETKSGLEWVTPQEISYEVTSSEVCKMADNCRFVEVTSAADNIYRVYFLDTGGGYKIVQFACVK